MSTPKKIIPLRPANEQDVLELADGGVCAQMEAFALMVKGDSMEPEFVEGHIILIDPSMPPVDGSFVVAEHAGGHIFRQLCVHQGKQYLRPLHDAYPTLAIERDSAIVGVITQRCGRRRKDIKHYV